MRNQEIVWGALVLRAYREAEKDRVLAVAAGVAFYGLLALLPAVTAFVSLYGLFVPTTDIADHLRTAGSLLPAAANEIVADQVNKLTAADPVALSVASIFGLVVSIWSTNSAMKAIMDALNVAYGVTDRRGIIRFNLTSMAMTVGAVLVVICMLLTLAAVPLILDRIWLGWATEFLLSYGRWALLFAILITAIAVLYRVGPDVPDARWRWISPGSLSAGVGLVVFSIGFSWYAENFAKYNETYGSLGAVIAFLVWGWLSATVVLFGAELNAELDKRIA